MSVLLSRAKKINEMPLDGVYVIYGNNGTGKTALAATFPKTKEKPMLIIDFLENGTSSVSLKDRENILVLPIRQFEELDEVLNDILNGYSINENGEQVPVQFSTIVFDSATQMEYLMKDAIMRLAHKGSMTLQLWGDAKDEHDSLWNLTKMLNEKTGSLVVVICHQKENKDEENPGNNKIIPSLMNSAAYGLCAKASFVWYTKVETEPVIDQKTNTVTGERNRYYTYIDSCQAYLTKTRKPVEMKIPAKVENLTYTKFKANIIDKITSTAKEEK